MNIKVILKVLMLLLLLYNFDLCTHTLTCICLRLTVVCEQVHLQGMGTAEAHVALWEGADARGDMAAVLAVPLRHHGVHFPQAPTAVVHEVSLQVSLTAEPDPTRLAGEDVLCRDGERGRAKNGGIAA